MATTTTTTTHLLELPPISQVPLLGYDRTQPLRVARDPAPRPASYLPRVAQRRQEAL